MNIPGAPGRGYGGGGSAAGMSEQEQAMVKAVSGGHKIWRFDVNTAAMADARRHGKLRWQDSPFRRHGLRHRRCLRPFHVECTLRLAIPETGRGLMRKR